MPPFHATVFVVATSPQANKGSREPGIFWVVTATPPSNYSDNLLINAGGAGGFLASVLAAGVQQPPAIHVSALATERGGAEGNLVWWGGATKPGSSLPSPPNASPAHIVNANIALFFIGHRLSLA